MTRQAGFTLVEIIASMLIVGVLAAIAAFGIATFMQSYATARENVAIAQKAGLAIERITLELRGITEVDKTCGSTCIRYRDSARFDGFRKIRYKDGRIEMVAPSTSGCDAEEAGKTLTDQIEPGSFLLTYSKEKSGDAWNPAADEPRKLGEIQVEFKPERNDGLAAKKFTLVINPRNTGMLTAPGVSS